MIHLSLARLYALRAGYLLMGLGLALVKWPELIHHSQAWTFWEGIANSLFTAMSLLALLGLRYPLQMLPVLLFETVWKLIWLSVVALPMWSSDRLDDTTRQTTFECLGVVLIIAVIPWRHVGSQYVARRSDRWLRAQPTPGD